MAYARRRRPPDTLFYSPSSQTGIRATPLAAEQTLANQALEFPKPSRWSIQLGHHMKHRWFLSVSDRYDIHCWEILLQYGFLSVKQCKSLFGSANIFARLHAICRCGRLRPSVTLLSLQVIEQSADLCAVHSNLNRKSSVYRPPGVATVHKWPRSMALYSSFRNSNRFLCPITDPRARNKRSQSCCHRFNSVV